MQLSMVRSPYQIAHRSPVLTSSDACLALHTQFGSQAVWQLAYYLAGFRPAVQDNEEKGKKGKLEWSHC